MKQNDFVRGITYAVAQLIRMHDQPCIGYDILHETGCSRKELLAACDDADRAALRKALNGRAGGIL